MSFDIINYAMNELVWYKSTSSNGMTPIAIKVLTELNRINFLKVIDACVDGPYLHYDRFHNKDIGYCLLSHSHQ